MKYIWKASQAPLALMNLKFDKWLKKENMSDSDIQLGSLKREVFPKQLARNKTTSSSNNSTRKKIDQRLEKVEDAQLTDSNEKLRKEN